MLPAPRWPQVAVQSAVQVFPARHWVPGRFVPASERVVLPPVRAMEPPDPEIVPPLPAVLPPEPAIDPPEVEVVPPVLFDSPPPEELQPTVKPMANPTTAKMVNPERFCFRIMVQPPLHGFMAIRTD
jgi:hypothetical protein